jgi:hypothetical protein
MSSSRNRLVIGVAAAGLLCAAPAIARVLASRVQAFACVGVPAGNFKVAAVLGTPPEGMPSSDWGIVNMNNSDLNVVCPVQTEFDTAVSRTVHDVSFLAAGTSDVRCTYYMLDTLAGGGYSSGDFGGIPVGGMIGGSLYSVTPTRPVQLANPSFTRQFFYCTLPKQVGGLAVGALRALEVRYDE